MSRDDLGARIWAKVDSSGDCWLWTGATSRGYGYISVAGKMRSVHRVVYEMYVGQADGLEIDHLCHNRGCVRVSHLRTVTHKQNMENLSGSNTRNKSGYRGVHWHKVTKKWAVAVGHHGRLHLGGYFHDVHEAGRAAEALRRKLYSEIPERDRQKRDTTLKGVRMLPQAAENVITLKEAQ